MACRNEMALHLVVSKLGGRGGRRRPPVGAHRARQVEIIAGGFTLSLNAAAWRDEPAATARAFFLEDYMSLDKTSQKV